MPSLGFFLYSALATPLYPMFFMNLVSCLLSDVNFDNGMLAHSVVLPKSSGHIRSLCLAKSPVELKFLSKYPSSCNEFSGGPRRISWNMISTFLDSARR